MVLTGSSFLLLVLGTVSVKANTVPLLVPAHSVGVELCAAISTIINTTILLRRHLIILQLFSTINSVLRKLLCNFYKLKKILVSICLKFQSPYVYHTLNYISFHQFSLLLSIRQTRKTIPTVSALNSSIKTKMQQRYTWYIEFYFIPLRIRKKTLGLNWFWIHRQQFFSF